MEKRLQDLVAGSPGAKGEVVKAVTAHIASLERQRVKLWQQYQYQKESTESFQPQTFQDMKAKLYKDVTRITKWM